MQKVECIGLEQSHGFEAQRLLQVIDDIVPLLSPECRALAENLRRDVVAAPEEAATILEGEEVDIVREREEYLFTTDRGLAHRCGLRHVTSNAIVTCPSCSHVWLQRRSHHKKQFPLHLTIPGGHVNAGSTPVATIRNEIAEELGLQQPLEGHLTLLCRHEWRRLNDTNVETRHLFGYVLTHDEQAKVAATAQSLQDEKTISTLDEFKALLEQRKKEVQGAGEVWGLYSITAEQFLSATSAGLQLTDIFATGPVESTAPFTPDLLLDIVESPEIVLAIKSLFKRRSSY